MNNPKKSSLDSRPGSQEAGFSLIDVVVTVAIVVALAVGGLIAYSNITQNARNSVLESTATTVYWSVLTADSLGTDPGVVIDSYNSQAGPNDPRVDMCLSTKPYGVVAFYGDDSSKGVVRGSCDAKQKVLISSDDQKVTEPKILSATPDRGSSTDRVEYMVSGLTRGQGYMLTLRLAPGDSPNGSVRAILPSGAENRAIYSQEPMEFEVMWVADSDLDQPIRFDSDSHDVLNRSGESWMRSADLKIVESTPDQ